jgi:hypothetical protein
MFWHTTLDHQLRLSVVIGRLEATCRPRPAVVRHVCAWCKREHKPRHFVPTGHGGTSHGICAECMAQALMEAA